MSESDIAIQAMKWLTDDGWDCYPEVRLYQGGNRADIVAEVALIGRVPEVP